MQQVYAKVHGELARVDRRRRRRAGAASAGGYQLDGMKNTQKILHGMKSTLKSPNLGIALATRELPLGLKMTRGFHPYLQPSQVW